MIYNVVFFYFSILVFMLGLLTSYLFAYFMCVVGRLYLPFDFMLIYLVVFMFVYSLFFILLAHKTILWMHIEDNCLKMGYLFKRKSLLFEEIQRVYVLYPHQRKPMEKRKPIGLDIMLKDGHRLSLGILDSKIIKEIVNVCVWHKISVILKYYMGEESYLEFPISSQDDFGL